MIIIMIIIIIINYYYYYYYYCGGREIKFDITCIDMKYEALTPRKNNMKGALIRRRKSR